MNTNAILDIAIGLVLMYLVLSLVCTSLNEMLSTLAGLRARTLRKSLQAIVDDPVVRGVFYEHGLIQGSFAPSAKPPITPPAAAPAGTPPPLPPASSATTALPSAKGHPAYLSGETFALALLDSLNAQPQAGALTFASIEQAAQALPDSNVRDLLVSNIALAENRIDTLRTNLATSFDHMMERTSGEYKRWLKWISLGIGLLVAIAVNADSIQVGKALWADAALRTQMAQSAQEIVKADGQLKCPVPPPAAAPAAAPSTAAATTAPPAATPAASSTVGDTVKKIQCAESMLRPLPIGWDQPTQDLSWGAFLLQKIGGLLMTGIALSLGAPFWFDLLSKFMQIRGTGQKPAPTNAGA